MYDFHSDGFNCAHIPFATANIINNISFLRFIRNFVVFGFFGLDFSSSRLNDSLSFSMTAFNVFNVCKRHITLSFCPNIQLSMSLFFRCLLFFQSLLLKSLRVFLFLRAFDVENTNKSKINFYFSAFRIIHFI